MSRMLFFLTLLIFLLTACAVPANTPTPPPAVPQATMAPLATTQPVTIMTPVAVKPDQPTATLYVPEPLPTEPPSPTQASLAEENIRAILGDPEAEPVFRYYTTHTENMSIQVAYYETAEAYFMVDIENDRVMYMYYFNPPGPRSAELSILELSNIVGAFLEQHVPCFPEVESELMLEIGGKGENRFFRWNATRPDPSRPNDQPPFLQVALHSDGFIFGFIDSGVCPLVAE